MPMYGGGMPPWMRGGGRQRQRDPYPWETLMDPSGAEALRASRLGEWQGIQQQALQDVLRGVHGMWGETGATTYGIGSSIPGQRTERKMGQWMREVGGPGRAQIEQAFLQDMQQREMMAQQMRYQWMAEQERAKRESGGGFLGALGGLVGAGLGAFGGPLLGGLGGGLAKKWLGGGGGGST